MDDGELARLEADLTDKLNLLRELQDEAADLAGRITAEYARRRAAGNVRPLRPRNGGPR